MKNITVWNLKGREPIVRTYSSGQFKEYTVRIQWSHKLGLTFNEKFDDYNSAEHVRLATINNGKITIAEWESVFYPGKGFIQTYAD
tara:strand:+ start:328 stop:585 length:258 start_codon:yes stop_codon:yes gene_type:complete